MPLRMCVRVCVCVHHKSGKWSLDLGRAHICKQLNDCSAQAGKVCHTGVQVSDSCHLFHKAVLHTHFTYLT